MSGNEYNHAEWLEQGMQGAEEDMKEKYKYFMKPDPAQRKLVGPIHKEMDELTGKVMRWREAKIGMMRGAHEESLKPMRVYLDPVPHVRVDGAKPLQGWYQNKTSATGHNRPRPCMTDAVLTQPYGGACLISCRFCYINAGGRGYRGSGLTTVPLNYGDYVRKELSKMKTSAAGYFSSFTEPFTPLEPYYHNTEQGARAFADAGLPVFFLSRLRYPDWAVELLQENKYSYAQKSINTPYPEIWKKLSPGALPLEDHWKDIKRLNKAGIYVSIQCNPVLPGVMNHKDIILNIERLAKAGANHVIVKFVETNYPWAPALIESVRKGFGREAGDKFASLFTQNIGGQRTIAEDYRMEGHHLYRAAATRCGITYATCYEYKYARDGQGQIINKIGVSVGSEFLTAASCHGPRVPMFTRRSLIEPFKEVEVCPPSGCLTCGDGQKKGLGPCGSKLYSAAKALTMKDFKYSIWDKHAPVGDENEAGKEDLVQITL